jgi:hypothetical protein
MDMRERRKRVEEMMLEEWSAEEIAVELGMPVRTVYRDMAAVRRENLVRRRPEAMEETVRELCRRAERIADRLGRLADKEGGEPMARVRAGYAAWEVHLGLAKLLQKMGYLPTAKGGRE